jgi:hypothetical protein
MLLWLVIGVIEKEAEDGVWLVSEDSESLFWFRYVLFITVDDDEMETWEDDDDSLKWSSPNISVQEDDSMDFTGLILLNERDSSSVGFSGNRLSKMCCKLSHVVMALLASKTVFYC